MGVSIREYARHRAALGLPGGSHTAVRKAIQTDRITAEPDGTIDIVRADAQWAGQTDPAKQRGVGSYLAEQEAAHATMGAPRQKPVSQAAIDAVQETLAEAGEDPDPAAGGQVSMKRAAFADKVLSVKLKQERLKRDRREVVDRARAVAMVFDLARKERDAWIGWPARVAANMAAELGCDPHQLEQVLDHYLRGHIAGMAEVKIDLR